MIRSLLLLSVLVFMTGLAVGQDKGKKEDPKNEEAAIKYKGQLPQYWGKLGLTDAQKQQVYKMQAKHNEEIEKLEKRIKEIKEKLQKERFEVLTSDQKKRLQELLKAKSGGE